MMADTKTAYGEEGLSLSKAHLEPAVLRDAISTSSTAPQDERFPVVRGKLTPNAPLAPLVWFKSGGSAEWLFEPKDVADLQDFVRDLDPATPIWPLGLGSNLIVRDGGVAGVTVRLGKAFAWVETVGKGAFGIDDLLRCGGGTSGILVASMARDHAIAGLEFLRGIPGTVGGFVRMNGGAYGREVQGILVECDVVLRSGELVTLPVADLGYTYRHSDLPDGCIVVSATFRGVLGDPLVIGAEMNRIAAEREASQPLRSKTGGSTFKNPDGHKAWQLVDAAGCRGLKIGGAQVSEKHTNFLLNTGDATSADIEALGEEVRKRVKAYSGITLEWEIQRVGLPSRLREGLGVGLSMNENAGIVGGDTSHPQPLPQAGGEL
jgi:UDP-N-acetylmuramate dehydrogenase